MAKRGKNIKLKRQNKRWEPDEDYVLMNSELTDEEIAEKLSRSVYAIHNRRHYLYREGFDEEDLQEV